MLDYSSTGMQLASVQKMLIVGTIKRYHFDVLMLMLMLILMLMLMLMLVGYHLQVRY